MTDPFLKGFPTDEERKVRVGRFVEEQLVPILAELEKESFDLEIGCGHGHWLTEFAMRESATVFVGIDLISRRIDKALSKRDKRNLSNLLFFKTEAKEFVTYLPEKLRIDNTYLMFPDPWPKHKHHKRRLIQSDFMELLAGKTAQGGNLFFRTDHAPYFDWTKELLESSSCWSIDGDSVPFEHTSYFQDLLPEFQTMKAAKVH